MSHYFGLAMNPRPLETVAMAVATVARAFATAEGPATTVARVLAHYIIH